MKVTYIGDAHHRIIDASDFPNRDDDFHYEWTPGSWEDVDNETAKFLLEYQRHEFVEYEDPKNRDQRTYDELMEEARELDITGRSKMDKEALRDAVHARRAEIEGESGAIGETETPSGTPEEVEEALGQDAPVNTQSDMPDRSGIDTD